MVDLADRVKALRQRMAAAAASSGRPPEAVTLVAASKTRSAAEVAAALAAGVDQIGENYVQEALAKRPQVPTPAVWRLIGPLQRNKAGHALRGFNAVDTLDNLELAQTLSRRWESADPPGEPLEVLIEVHLGGEATKSGIEPAQVGELLDRLQLLPGLQCLGLMTMPPPLPAEQVRGYFAQLRELAGDLRARSGLALPVLSMGMSADFEVAIAEGATQVRLGTVLFGPRGPR
ncbi:MAG: YggS family pyridoxal phosphate-dependent enzyme [Armatimonadetes bacterium]|nr:YggS family pyridoxal phosphate-dependent enzyme [Armatimonadota bacterium]